MDIYVARHGQTDWNHGGRIMGLTDVGLNETGIVQAENLARDIAEKNIKLDLIISSPLKRTVQTSEIVASLNPAEIITDKRLIEQDYGIYEGKDRLDEGFLKNKRQFACRYPNGESMMQVAARVYSLLDEIRKKYAGKTLLLVSHGGTIRVLNTYFEDMPNDDFFHWLIDNAQLKKYSL